MKFWQIVSFLVFLVFVAWAVGTRLGEFQKKVVNNCPQARAELGLCPPTGEAGK